MAIILKPLFEIFTGDIAIFLRLSGAKLRGDFTMQSGGGFRDSTGPQKTRQYREEKEPGGRGTSE